MKYGEMTVTLYTYNLFEVDKTCIQSVRVSEVRDMLFRNSKTKTDI